MADVKISQIAELGYFSARASAYANAVATALHMIEQQLRTNLNDAQATVERIREDVASLEATCDEENWYLVEVRQQQLTEATNLLTQLKSVFAQLLDEAHATRSQVGAHASAAADFVSRYAAYLNTH